MFGLPNLDDLKKEAERSLLQKKIDLEKEVLLRLRAINSMGNSSTLDAIIRWKTVELEVLTERVAGLDS